MKKAKILTRKQLQEVKGSEFPIWEFNKCLEEASAIEDDNASAIMIDICLKTIN